MFRILVIDDDAVMRKLMQKTLAAEGYECVLAENLTSGLDTCRKSKPDLLLMDVNLPDGNGIEACRQVKAEPGLKHIPVIILTGEAVAVENRVDGIEAGAEDYLLKPFLPKELVSRVKNILKSSSGPSRS